MLDATITAIVRYGYRGASSARIAELSGFTRGAQKHHFRNKAEMVTEALVHLHERIGKQLLERMGATPSSDLTTQLALAWEIVRSEAHAAAAELRTAARIDDELRVALRSAERRMMKRWWEADALWLGDETIPRARRAAVAEHVLYVLRGMATEHGLAPDPEREAASPRLLEEAVRALLKSG